MSKRSKPINDLSAKRLTHSADPSLIQSIDDLLQLHDRVFVDAAYQVMLRRAADVTGIEAYLRRLRLGYSRVGELDRLSRSPEANPRWEIPGLRHRLERFRRQRRGWKGLWRRWTDPEFGMRFPLRQLRAIENAVGAARQDMLAACADLAAEQQNQQELLSALLRRTADKPGRDPRRSSGASNALIAHTVYDVRETDLPPSARDALKALRL